MQQDKNVALYNVGLKILLKKNNEFLFLTYRANKHIDLPGGRIDEDERDMPLEKIIEREVREELGPDLKYKLGKPLLQFRRYWKDKDMYIFIIIYEADYISGEIELSSEHSKYEWIAPKNFYFPRANFSSNEEYLAFKNYFKTLTQ
jgi:8-oxo-dGTP diphosphatase